MTPQQQNIAFQIRHWNRLLFTTALLRHRRFDGHILSMQQSGTHWLRYMLGICIAETYGQPHPDHIQSEIFVGDPRQPPAATPWPRLVSSHTLPHVLMYSPTFCRGLHFPRYLLLVRDIRHALVSHYEKWNRDYSVDFSTYLQGDPWGHRYYSDIWRCFEILNAYGRLSEAGAVATRIIRYEDLQRDPAAALTTACDWFRIPAAPTTIATAVRIATKEQMAQRSKPRRQEEQVIRRDSHHPFAWYTPENRTYLTELTNRHLQYTFGYDYGDWNPESVTPARSCEILPSP